MFSWLFTEKFESLDRSNPWGNCNSPDSFNAWRISVQKLVCPCIYLSNAMNYSKLWQNPIRQVRTLRWVCACDSPILPVSYSLALLAQLYECFCIHRSIHWPWYARHNIYVGSALSTASHIRVDVLLGPLNKLLDGIDRKWCYPTFH